MLRYGNVIDVCCMTGQLMMRIQRGYGYDQDTEVDDKDTEVGDGMRRL